MTNIHLFSVLIFMSLLLLLNASVQATPEVGFDFSQTSNTVEIDTLSTATPNILRTVTIVCPDDGFTVATANALFSFNVSNTNFPGTIAYSLSRNSTSFQSNHQHNIFGRYVDNFQVLPVTIQRIDSCSDGQSVTYRFLATRGTFSFDVSAKQPNLVVVFYRDRI
jgi:hypothetical protein